MKRVIPSITLPGVFIFPADFADFLRCAGKYPVVWPTIRRLASCLICAAALGSPARAQDTLRLDLQQVVALAREQSLSARQAATTKETKYWEFRSFQADYKPQLLLSGELPAFSRNFQQVYQPDGSVKFQPVRNNNSSLTLSLEQRIRKTGATVFAASRWQRFDDFDRNNTLYNGAPFSLGILQPLFQFNPLKWEARIAPLKYRESRQEYVESMESIGYEAGRLFFDLLLAQVNVQIAQTNLENTVRILAIAREKFDIGAISRNEILQLELEQLKAQKASVAARRDLEISAMLLRSFTGMKGQERIRLAIPTPEERMTLDAEILLQQAFQNRSDAIAFQRRKLEAQRQVAQAKKSNGINAALSANLGYSNSSESLNGILQQPQNYQALQIELDIPLMDWGRAKSRIKTAEANSRLTEYTLEQEQQDFRQEIITEVTLFEMLQNQLELTAKADSIASEKYLIAQERYVLGNLSITDLSIAFAEKDQAKRDYIGSLRDYWSAYFRLRLLALYDPATGKKIE